MKDQDYIRKAVELADDFGWTNKSGSIFFYGTPSCPINPRNCPQWFKDALAAQLVRQVDSTKYRVLVDYDETTISDGEECEYKFVVYGKDRSMNTIKVVVDSKVLGNR